MSRAPPRNDRGYQPAGGPGLPPRPGSSGLFDRRTPQQPAGDYGRPPPPPAGDYGRNPPAADNMSDYRNSPRGYDQRSVERRPVAQPQQQHGSGFLSRLTGRGPEPKQQGGVFRVSKAPNPEAPFMNLLYVSPQDFPGNIGYVIVEDMYVFTVQHDPTVQPGFLGTNLYQREWGRWGLNQDVTVALYDPFSQGEQVYLGSMDLELSFTKANFKTDHQLDSDELAKFFASVFQSQIFAPGQKLAMDYRSLQMKVVVKAVECVDLTVFEKGKGETGGVTSAGHVRGILTPETSITFFKSPESNIRIKASAKRPPPNAIIQPNFKFEDMGIGGLDSEFGAIFRRAFASRIFPPGLVEKLGIQHVRGILLYGPPGTGKTLMARQIGKMLNAKEPKIVNGPEILNKFVGQSEENIRKLFADAEKEYKEKGDQSDLHIIIFDELDAITKQRGTTGGGTGVGDTVVNQLLSKMDGVDQLNNILIIGMTNRFDMIDEALLRPGRLEVHMEINLPDAKGRLQILKIHTEKMRKNKIMADDVDLQYLADQTKNFSGAEIAGLIKSATSFAFNRHVKVGSMANYKDDISEMKVNRQDFEMALDEVRPAFGVSEEELDACVQGGLITYSGINDILREGKLYVEQVRTSDRTHLVSVLMHGPPGSGKSALAASIAMASDFAFIKLISPEAMVGYNEPSKIQYISKVFNDSYKSPNSLIVVDNIERLLDWTALGARFSNAILQTLLVLFRKRPPKERRLLIIGTTSERSVLRQMDVINVFDAEIPVPTVPDLKDLSEILKSVNAFDDQTRHDVINELETMTQSQDVKVGIKKILSILETSRQDEDVGRRFVDLMANSIAESIGGGLE